jgi:hypothetical protein
MNKREIRMSNKQFALVATAIQTMGGILILSCRYSDIHWLCLFNITAAIMFIYKYLSDDE